MTLAKEPPFRSRKLLDTAKGKACAVRLPGCLGLDGVVWAHSNQLRHGKGTGLKAHDCFGCFACTACHHELDNGNTRTKAEKEDAFMLGFERTLLTLWTTGKIKVA